MSEAAEPQFDRAEFENASTQCAACNRPLAGFYFEANGQTVCEACRYELEAQMTGGSAGGRAIRALGAGFVAAALGAVLYYAIAALSGYEFGLIAIVVGYGVGAAVRWGSNGRGGWPYQALAMALTYFAIVATYIPPIVQGLRQAQAAEAAAVSGSTTAPSTEAAVTPASTTADATAQPETAEQTVAPGGASIILGVLLLLAVASVAPFLAGFQNIIGLIIIGIGLYEAWKLNRRAVLTITGPHTIGAAAAV
jgi:hypothetical protein